MLIRNLSTKSDRVKELKKQTETLRLAIANDNNIAQARKNANEGIMPPPVEGQVLTSSQITEDANTNMSRARDNLLEVFSFDRTRRILTQLTQEQIKFFNIYWNDIKQELKKGNPSLIDPQAFMSIFEAYLKRTISQKGIGDKVDINDLDELNDVVPDDDIVGQTLARVRPLNSQRAEELRSIRGLFPTPAIYRKIQGLSEADQEKYVKQLVKAFSNVAPRSEWVRVNNLRGDADFLANVVDLYRDFNPTQQRRVAKTYEQATREKPTKTEKATNTYEQAKVEKAEKGIQAGFKPTRGFSSEGMKERKAEQDRLSKMTEEERMEERIAKMSPEDQAKFRKIQQAKKGKGIKQVVDSLPRWVQIGKLKFNNRLLDEKQLISIKYPSGAHNPHFPKSIPVSDMFHELMTTLTDTQKVDKRLLNELEPAEKTLFEKFIVRSGAGRKMGISEVSKNDDEKQKEERYMIVKGSYLSGNNSPEIINELRSLILYFVETGRIDKRSALATLRSIV
jgi:hypothetical protein